MCVGVCMPMSGYRARQAAVAILPESGQLTADGEVEGPPKASHGRAGISRVVEKLGGVHSVTVAGLHDKVARGTLIVCVSLCTMRLDTLSGSTMGVEISSRRRSGWAKSRWP